MKQISLLFLLLSVPFLNAQTKGSFVGEITDTEYNNEPLSFANVVIKNTEKGALSDIDGLFAIENLDPGIYTAVFSFVGYETVEIENIKVQANKVTSVIVPMSTTAAALDEVVIKTTTRRESEVILLLEQKRANAIVESIGSDQLNKMGISNVAAATTKISGVSKTEGSGNLFIRGLGDRYLYTTLNGLPIPSDDIERKNIDLALFPTRLIQSVSVGKTNSSKTSADQTSGNIDIASKELNGDEIFSLSANSAVNSNVMDTGVFNNFKVSANTNDVKAGFYFNDFETRNAITEQSWSPKTNSFPINHGFSFTAGKRITEKLSILLTAGQATSFEYHEGVFRQFRSNFINDSILDASTWKKNITTSALLHLKFKANQKNKVKFNSFLINKIDEEVFEGGRDGHGTFFEETAPNEGLSQFVRDQNLKKTLVWISQLHGTHALSDRNSLNWAASYNILSADEPNRIRNEVNFNETIVQLGRTGGFQQRKSNQIIEDTEYNGLINEVYKLVEDQTNSFQMEVGATYRNKTRDFKSEFVGVEEAFTNAVNPESIDKISEIFTQENFNNGKLKLNVLPADLYDGQLESIAGYVDFVGTAGKFTAEVGLRFQRDVLNVDFDVNNFPGRKGSAHKDYRKLYPSVNVKYAINETQNLRFANSSTSTLPEFKEIAPFEYVSPVGQITRGNPEIEASTNYNYDLKWEFFPSNDQLFSLTGFYKKIENPINKVQDRGAAGIFSYFNSGNQAKVYGIELESRINLLADEVLPNLKLNLNASRMWHKQDLKEVYDDTGNFIRTFRYKGLTQENLQGASEWIVNASLNFDTGTENPFEATLSGNYASDRVYALGAPESQTTGDVNYNDAIIENGFVTLDLILKKKFSPHWEVGFSAKNLINPEIKRTQLIRPATSGIETEKTVLSYSLGTQLGLTLSYTF